MVGLAIISISFTLSILLLVVRLSIAFVFRVSTQPKNAKHVFKVHFPYYIITLGAICTYVIIALEFHIIAFIYMGIIYIMALGIWKFLLTKSQKTKTLQIEGTSSSK
jgi:uncharacterized membrane protein